MSRAPIPTWYFALVVVRRGHRFLLTQEKKYGSTWSIPGGRVEPGETLVEAAIREVHEETGLDVEPVAIVGIYSDPKHVFAYDDGEVRQEFSICLECRITGGSLAVSDESFEVKFHTPSDIEGLDMVNSIRLRLTDYLADLGPAIR